MISRRKTLALIGGGLIVAAGSGAYAVTRTPKGALKPWDMAGSYQDPRMRALSWAILSPNPHNRQPWKVDLSEPDQVQLFVDTDRLLPHTDPFSRQIVIGLGCFLETLKIAAAEDGYDLDIDLFPQGFDPVALDDRPVAQIAFLAAQANPDPDFALLPERRTQKEPYDLQRTVSDAALRDLESSVKYGSRIGTTNDMDRVQQMRALSGEALRIEIETPHTYKESVDLFRIGRAEVDANPDGIDFTGPMFETLHLTGQFSREIALDQSSMAYQAGLDAVMENTRTAMGHVWLVTEGNSRVDQINVGRDWMRLNLATTRAGLGIQPLSQALQEYPEMSELYAKIHKDLAAPGETVQMWARLGYCAPVPPSPRWPLDAKIMNA